MKKINSVLILSLLCFALPLTAQEDDGFGFGFGFGEEEGGTPGASASGAKVNGKVSAGFTFFPDEFVSKGDESALDRAKRVQLGNVFSGELKFSAASSGADAVINLKLTPNFDDPAKILSFDEAYIRAFFGDLMLEGGLRKLSWGRADSLGPLDLVNPLDYTDISRMADYASIKIARPMLHASLGLGPFTKVEGVFLPWFQADRFAPEGRWEPAQLRQMPGRIEGRLISDPDLTLFLVRMASTSGLNPNDLMALMPKTNAASFNTAELLDTSTLEYFQGGLRFTTTLGPADFGVQYYYGLHSRPSYRVNAAAYDDLITNKIPAYYAAYVAYQSALDPTGSSNPPSYPPKIHEEAKDKLEAAEAAMKAAMDPSVLLDIVYNRYHHIGVDYGQVLFGFNTRAEFGANITEDLSGDDGLVYNPALVWSLGFDRDIPVVKINVNLQVNESIILLHDKLGNDPLFEDVEAGKKLTSTRLILRLSRTFFRDELELQATAIWGIEDQDAYLMPGLVWTKGDVALEVSGGIFAGNRDGELGQYRDNYYVKTLLSYSF